LIGVGNLTVGGTGKTPHVEYLVKLLHPKYKLGTLSRGYGRKTIGFRLATKDATTAEIGDEPKHFEIVLQKKFLLQLMGNVCMA